MNDNYCVSSPTKEHQFKDITDYTRDDSGFYLPCMHCPEWVMFDVDTEEDLYALFGATDDDFDDEYDLDDEDNI